MTASAIPDDDDDVVARLLGRAPAAAYTVVVRRRGGSPVVIENAPFLRDGSPMPTRYWLLDRDLCDEVSRLEAAGGVRRAAAEVSPDAVAEAHARYAAARDIHIPPEHQGPAPSGGVGGTRRGVKCLHAHLAWCLAGGDDPVGRWTAQQLAVDLADFTRTEDQPGPPVGRPVAAVDCGTNSTRLLVVDETGRTLAREMRITRLGAGVDATRRLSAEAVERTLSVLREFRRLMDHFSVSRARAAATSAVRDSINAELFMEGATEALGFRPEVLPGLEEGRLAFLGATARLPAALAGSGPVLVVDIGGGSTELIAGHRGRSDVSAVSLDLGCVRVSERYFGQDPPSRTELSQARLAVEREVQAARAALPPLSPAGDVVGLAGTISTVAALVGAVRQYERARLHHAVVSRAEVGQWLDVLATEDSRTRLGHPGMAPGREDVIVGGVLILDVVMEQFDRGRCVYSEDDILDGITTDLLECPPPA